MLFRRPRIGGLIVAIPLALAAPALHHRATVLGRCRSPRLLRQAPRHTRSRRRADFEFGPDPPDAEEVRALRADLAMLVTAAEQQGDIDPEFADLPYEVEAALTQYLRHTPLPVAELDRLTRRIIAASDGRRRDKGGDEHIAFRMRVLDMLRRIREATAAAQRNQVQIAGKISRGRDEYPVIGIRPDGETGAQSPAMSAAAREQLGIGIRSLREARGLTQKELARLVGYTQPHLSEVEKGKREPRGALVAELIRVLRPRNADLASGEPE